MLSQVLNPLKVQVVLEREEITIDDFNKDPLRSNQIWINGRLVEDWIAGEASKTMCCDICGPNECRAIKIGSEVYEVIPAEIIIKAGLIAAYELIKKKANESCCINKTAKTSNFDCC